VVDDTFTAHLMLARYGGPAWFSLGDADLATHVERTRRLRIGESLTDATAAMGAALGVRAHVLPSSDDRWQTRIVTDDGELDFQEYFVHRRQEPIVRGVRFDGDAAAPTPQVLDAIAAADLVVIGPSNPIVSIGPTLELPGVRDALRSTDALRVAVSPIVGGRALKGPADRMLASMGHEVSAPGVARLYAGLVDRFVLDEVDAGLAAVVGAIGLEAAVLPTVMATDDERRSLAEALLPGT
ncbi:MAG TPA: 2-phospho-L-lactate transferase CofD family protein, partial [Candidatus Limnocylindria bacterium]|nr:2-phospho-L-lactate transferase CofD family protein [Candidatus Limnocylindria bacterium]